VEMLKQLERAQEPIGRGFGHNDKHHRVQCVLH